MSALAVVGWSRWDWMGAVDDFEGHVVRLGRSKQARGIAIDYALLLTKCDALIDDFMVGGPASRLAYDTSNGWWNDANSDAGLAERGSGGSDLGWGGRALGALVLGRGKLFGSDAPGAGGCGAGASGDAGFDEGFAIGDCGQVVAAREPDCPGKPGAAWRSCSCGTASVAIHESHASGALVLALRRIAMARSMLAMLHGGSDASFVVACGSGGLVGADPRACALARGLQYAIAPRWHGVVVFPGALRGLIDRRYGSETVSIVRVACGLCGGQPPDDLTAWARNHPLRLDSNHRGWS